MLTPIANELPTGGPSYRSQSDGHAAANACKCRVIEGLSAGAFSPF